MEKMREKWIFFGEISQPKGEWESYIADAYFIFMSFVSFMGFMGFVGFVGFMGLYRSYGLGP